MVKVRPAGSMLLLTESMAQSFDCGSLAELQDKTPLPIVEHSPVGRDDRIGWNTWVVCVRTPGREHPQAAWFTDGPFPESAYGGGKS